MEGIYNLKFATFNIWNKQTMWDQRLDAICEEIKNINPDIIALQEVKSFLEEKGALNAAQQIANRIEYPFCIFREYPDSPDEGLAILSKLPLLQAKAIWDTEFNEENYCALRIVINYGGTTYGFTNVHLNWRSPEIRLKQIQTVNKWISEDFKSVEILSGDFNDNPNSNIHRYLQGSLWVDTAEFYENTNLVKAKPTLDFKNNNHLIKLNSSIDQHRYDWILIKVNEAKHTLEIHSVDVFANYPSKSLQIFPSDHYGVVITTI